MITQVEWHAYDHAVDSLRAIERNTRYDGTTRCHNNLPVVCPATRELSTKTFPTGMSCGVGGLPFYNRDTTIVVDVKDLFVVLQKFTKLVCVVEFW